MISLTAVEDLYYVNLDVKGHGILGNYIRYIHLSCRYHGWSWHSKRFFRPLILLQDIKGRTGVIYSPMVVVTTLSIVVNTTLYDVVPLVVLRSVNIVATVSSIFPNTTMDEFSSLDG